MHTSDAMPGLTFEATAPDGTVTARLDFRAFFASEQGRALVCQAAADDGYDPGDPAVASAIDAAIAQAVAEPESVWEMP